MQVFPKIHITYFYICLKCQYDKPLQQIIKRKISQLIDESRIEHKTFQSHVHKKKSRFEYKFLVLRLYIINIELIRKTAKPF